MSPNATTPTQCLNRIMNELLQVEKGSYTLVLVADCSGRFLTTPSAFGRALADRGRDERRAQITPSLRLVGETHVVVQFGDVLTAMRAAFDVWQHFVQ